MQQGARVGEGRVSRLSQPVRVCACELLEGEKKRRNSGGKTLNRKKDRTDMLYGYKQYLKIKRLDAHGSVN